MLLLQLLLLLGPRAGWQQVEEALDHVHPRSGHIAHAEYGHDVLLEGVAGGGDAVVAALDDERDLVGADRLEERLQRVERRLQLVVRRRVHLER